MSLINNIIPKQGFEQIRDQIGVVIKTEIENQFLLTYNPLLDKLKVLLEKRNPLDKSQMPYINVSFETGEYGTKEYNGNVQSTYTYNIDCFAQAKSTSQNDGDSISQTRMHQLLGLCRYILEDPIYRTLAFQPGSLVARTYLTTAEADNNYKMDAIQDAMGRLKLTVIATENNQLIQAPLIAGFTTKFFVNETSEGYLYIDNE